MEHILEATRDVESFAAGKSLQDDLREAWLRLATQRGLEIISEASRHIPDNLEHSAIWGVVDIHLPPLRAAVEEMLRDLPSGQGGR